MLERLELVPSQVLAIIWRLCIRVLVMGVVVLNFVLSDEFLIVDLVNGFLILVLDFTNEVEFVLDFGVLTKQVPIEFESVLEVVVLETLEPLVDSDELELIDTRGGVSQALAKHNAIIFIFH